MKITLKKKKLKNGKFSLYLEYYKGSQLDKDGKRIHIRDFEYLKLYLHQNPLSASEKKENKETELLAEQILSIRKAEFFQGKFDIKNTSKSKRRFLDFFIEKTEEKSDSPKNYGNWTATFLHLKRCINPNLLFEEVDEDFVKMVRNYFDKDAKTKSNLPLSLNSKYSYLNKFKACLRAAFDEGYLSINYASKINVNVVPLFSLLLNSILPAISLIYLSTILSPKPVPGILPVLCALKNA